MPNAAVAVKVDSRPAAGKNRAMDETRVAPEACETMAQVRAGVDAVDARLAALIGERFRYMDAAARIKLQRGLVRDEARKAEVIANARANARVNGTPGELAEALWERLIEASIAYELEAFDRR